MLERVGETGYLGTAVEGDAVLSLSRSMRVTAGY